MQSFNSLFPTFLTTCTQLKATLMPVAYLLIVVGMVSSTISGQRSAGAYMRTFGRSIVYIMLLTYLVTWGNQMTQVVDTTVTQVIKADPSNVFNEYNAALIAKKSTGAHSGWWDKISHAGASVFEAIVSGFLWLFGLLASAIMFYSYILQKMVLYLGYSLSPIFVGFLAIRSLSGIGGKYFMGLAGIMVWPLGWAVAAIVTDGLLKFMTDQSFLTDSSFTGTVGYGLQNFIGLGFLGVWIIFSTIAAPLIIQRAITEGFQVGTSLLGGATSAGLGGLVTGASTGAALAARGGSAVTTAGLATAAGMAAGLSAVAGSGYDSHGRSLINSLAYQNDRQSARSASSETTGPKFASDDVTGAKAAKELIQRTKNGSQGNSKS